MCFLCVFVIFGSFIDSLLLLCESLVSFIDPLNSFSVLVWLFSIKSRLFSSSGRCVEKGSFRGGYPRGLKMCAFCMFL